MSKRSKRFGIQALEGGGTSIGWTSIASFRRCMRRGYWGLLHGGNGIQLPPMPPEAPVLYGQMWHRGYCAHWREEDIKEALLRHLDEEELSANQFVMLVDEVVRDLDWYFQQQRGGTKIQVLSCEEELSYDVTSPWTGLTHRLRGTPDLVGIDVGSDSIVMPDHKTFKVIRYDAGGGVKLYMNPNPETIQKNQVTRQFPFYCVAPSHRTLTANLEWVPIGDLKIGDELLAFSEYPKKGEKARRLCKSIVQAMQPKKINTGLEVCLSDGTHIKCTPEHPFLAYPFSSNPSPAWIEAQNLAVGQKLPRYFTPWENNRSYEVGYLSAAFSGEGCLMKGKENGRDFVGLSFSQKDNAFAEDVVRYAKQLNFKIVKTGTINEVGRYEIQGGRPEIYRFLGLVRPVRLLANALLGTTGYLKFDRIPTREVIAIHRSSFEVMQMQTSSKTYFTEGFGSHNCYLWNGLHPDQKCFDALLNMVPQNVTAVLNILSERDGKKTEPKVHRVPLEAYKENYINEVGMQAIRLCDTISQYRNQPSGTFGTTEFDQTLSQFPENEAACVGWGSLCSFYALDRESDDVRMNLLSESFVAKE